MPAGPLSIECRDSDAAKTASGANAAHTAAKRTRAVATATTGKAQVTAEKANASQPAHNLHGCPADSFCVWSGPNLTGDMRTVATQYGNIGYCYILEHRDGNRSLVDNTQKSVYSAGLDS